MKRGYLLLRCLAVVFLIAVFSCATPRVELTSVWKDQSYKGGFFKKILVISAARKDAIRNFSEDEFSRQLKGRGPEAIQSYTMIPFAKMLDKAVVADKIRGMGLTAYL